MDESLDSDYFSSAVPAKKEEPTKREASAGSVYDEFVALATDEEQNEADETPQPASSPFLPGTADLMFIHTPLFSHQVLCFSRHFVK